MKIYLSYSSRGYQKIPSEFLINLHKVCFFYLKKYFDEIYFITDSNSEIYFKNIPWTKIFIELDDVPIDYPEVWSLSKIIAYQKIAKKGDPFMHIDSDVILWKPLPNHILKSEIFVQSPEKKLMHMYNLQIFKESCSNLHLLKNLNIEYAYNLGVLGVNNLDFIQKYTEKALEFIYDPKNENFWKIYQNPYRGYWWKAILAEQYFFAGAALYYNQKIECIFKNCPSEFMELNDSYTHLLISKKNKEIQDRINLLANKIIF